MNQDNFQINRIRKDVDDNFEERYEYLEEYNQMIEDTQDLTSVIMEINDD